MTKLGQGVRNYGSLPYNVVPDTPGITHITLSVAFAKTFMFIEFKMVGFLFFLKKKY